MSRKTRHFLSNPNVVLTLLVSISLALLTTSSVKIQQRRARPAVQLIDWTKAADSTIAIMDSEGRICGTGFLVSQDGDTVTAAHVVRGIRKQNSHVFVRLRGHHEMHRASIAAISDALDIAILRTDIKQNVFFRLSESDSLKPGDKLYTIGHPYGVPWQVSEGLFSRPGMIEGRSVLWVSVWIERGCSGGPLLNTKGEVVGLVSAFYNAFAEVAGHTNICVTGTDIIRMLRVVQGS